MNFLQDFTFSHLPRRIIVLLKRQLYGLENVPLREFQAYGQEKMRTQKHDDHGVTPEEGGDMGEEGGEGLHSEYWGVNESNRTARY